MAHDHQVTDIDNSKDDKSHTINRSDISPTVDFPEGVFCPTVLDPVLEVMDAYIQMLVMQWQME